MGIYTLKLDLAADQPTGKVTVEINGKAVAQSVNVPETGGLTNFRQIALKNIKLGKGKQVLRILADNGGFNFNSIQFTK